MNKRILVTGAGGASGLSTIRLLKSSTKHEIFGADITDVATGLYMADKKFIIPKAKDKNFISTIMELIQKEKIDLVIPNVDDELSIFAANKDTIPQALVSSLETIQICDDKLKTIEYFADTIPVPKSFLTFWQFL